MYSIALISFGIIFLGIPTRNIQAEVRTAFTCPSYQGYFPDHLDCNKFYQCDHWISHHMSCPAVLHWDVALTTCNYPLAAKCQVTTTTPAPTTTTRSTPPRPSTTTCRPASTTESTRIQVEGPDDNPHFIVGPREDGVCGDPPVIIPVEPGTKKNITVTFQLALHPLDVYYLMDFSGSMRDDKANLVRLSSELVRTVSNLTKDYRLGFGAFVDKPKPSLGALGDYSFRNAMPLTSDTLDFTKKIQDTPILNGNDIPESAGDAMYQVVACGGDIGWRSNTRRLLIVATDANFHQAGDGKKYGMTDFDGGCYVNSVGHYTKELILDYPSEQQIVDLMNEQGVIIVFAVTSDYKTYYERIAAKIKPSVVGILSSDSSNIINLIKEQYRQIESRVEIESGETTEEITIKYFSNCRGDTEVETSICENVGGGDVTFTLEIDVDVCPLDPKDWNQVIRINPFGLPSTFLDIALSLICGTAP